MLHKAIRFLRATEINRELWDRCVQRTNTHQYYAYSWYLDCMAENWGGLVYGDYEAVMPIPYKTTWGVSYIYTPFFIQQLGIFAPTKSSLELEYAFLNAIPWYFIKIHTTLHANSKLLSQPHITLRKNYILSLNKTYDYIRTGYRKDVQTYLKHPQLQVKTCERLHEILSFYKSEYRHIFQKIKPDDFQRFENLCNYMHQTGRTEVLCAYKETVFVAACICWKHSAGLTLMVNASNTLGKKLKASYILIDFLIKKYAENNMVLDFEGSEIPEIAFFFKKFGPVETRYGVYKSTMLKRLYELLKKAPSL